MQGLVVQRTQHLSHCGMMCRAVLVLVRSMRVARH